MLRRLIVKKRFSIFLVAILLFSKAGHPRNAPGGEVLHAFEGDTSSSERGPSACATPNDLHTILQRAIDAYYEGNPEQSIALLQAAIFPKLEISRPVTTETPAMDILGTYPLASALAADPAGLAERAIDSNGRAENSSLFFSTDPSARASSTSYRSHTRLAAELFRLYQEIGPLGSFAEPYPETDTTSNSTRKTPSSDKPLSNLTVYQSTLKTLGTFLLSANTEDPELQRELFIAAVLAGEHKAARSFLPLTAPSAESYLYEGLLALEQGSFEEGISRLRTALSMEDIRPAPWYFLGKALVATGKMAEGEAAFRSALKKDGSFLPALIAQSETALAQGKVQEGYALLSRLVQILPRQREFQDRLAQLLEQHPELVAKISEVAKGKLLRKEPARILPFSGDASKIPTIRVALAQNLSSLSFKISSPYVAKWIGPNGQEETKTLSPGIYRLLLREPQEPLDPEIQPLLLPEPASSGSPSSMASTGAYLYPTVGNSTVLFFDLVTEAGSFIATISDRSYRGFFQVVPSEEGFHLINHVNLEEYLYSVLPSEIPASWPLEAVKAQAIAARSYSLAMMAQSTTKPFDVYGSTRSASYRGVESEHPRSTVAVDATRGVYLRTDKGPLVAFYHANNGGYGEGTESVWGYTDTLPPVPDPLTAARTGNLSLSKLTDWLRSSPPSFASLPGFHYPEAYRWERWVTPDEIAARLGKDAPPGRVVAVLTRGRGISGRVKEVEIRTEGGSVRLKGDRVRITLGGLRSTLFTLRVKVGKDGYPEYFIFNGGGWGHGVGLDQSGAAGMASVGYTAEEILRHYYPNATLESNPIPQASSR